MGKSKKPSTFDYFTGSGGVGKAMKRYGVSAASFGGRPGEWGGGDLRDRRLPEDIDKELANAARNDYDTRRTLEAAAMSGKKKAKDILKGGFDDINNIIKASNFMEKAAKRHGQGGDFSSTSDFMGLTQSMVERERRIHNQQIDQRMEKFMEDRKGGGEDDVPEYQIDNPIGQRGGRENNTSGVYDDYQDAYKLAGIGNDYYSTGGEGQAATEASVGSGNAGAAAQLAEFQKKVKTGMALAGVQTRGPQAGVVPGDGF